MRSTILALVASLFAFAVTARADDETPAPKKPTMPVKTEVAKPAGKKVTIDELGNMLDALGYNPTPTKDKEGNVDGYNLEYTSGTWTMRMYIDISKNKSEICVSGSIGTLSEGTELPLAAAMELLTENGMIYPATIYFLKKSQQFRVYQSYTNEKLTNGNLRTKLDAFAETLKQVATKFNKAKETAPDVNPAPAPAPLR